MAQPHYQRLTRARLRRYLSVISVQRVSLWLGSDHLLHVESAGFLEAYKRFYFRDIQAITVSETSGFSVLNAVLGVPALIALVGLAVSSLPSRNIAAMIFWAIVLAVFLTPLLINVLRGPTCNVELRTAVQTEQLASLSRLRQTRKVLARLRPLIIAAQGELTADDISTRMRLAAAGLSTPPAPEAAAGPPPSSA